MGLYTPGQMRMDPVCGLISYSCCFSNALKLKLGHNPKICFVDMQRATWKEIAEQIIRPAKVIPPIRVKARCAQLLIILHRL